MMRRMPPLRMRRVGPLGIAAVAATLGCGASPLASSIPSLAARTATLRLFSVHRPAKSLLARVAGGTGGESGAVQPNEAPSAGESSSRESTADSLTPQVREHLFRVYNVLGAGIVTAGIGSSLIVMTSLGKVVPFWVPMLGGFHMMLWLGLAPPRDPRLRMALFFAFTFLEGMGIAPIVLATLPNGVLGTALILTAAVFGGFSAAAYLSPRASMLALQGPLFGMLIGMVAISFLNIFFPSAFAHSIILYGGLALFSMFIAVDTQAMIERARCGAGDPVQDAVQMFLNVLNVFVRIAQILMSRE